MAKDHNDQIVLDKETFLVNHPDYLQKFGMDVLPLLIQVGWFLLICKFSFFFSFSLLFFLSVSSFHRCLILVQVYMFAMDAYLLYTS